MEPLICDSYSQACITPPPVFTPQPAPTYERLPLTGFTYGETILVAVCMLLVGLAFVYLTRQRKA